MDWRDKLIEVGTVKRVTTAGSEDQEGVTQGSMIKRFFEELEQQLATDLAYVAGGLNLLILARMDYETRDADDRESIRQRYDGVVFTSSDSSTRGEKRKWSLGDRYLLLRLESDSGNVIVSVSTDLRYEQLEVYPENGRLLTMFEDRVSVRDAAEISQIFVQAMFS